MSERESSSTIREHAASPFTWYVAIFAVLLLAAIAMTVRLGFDWASIRRDSSEALVSKQFELKAMEHETAPLRGLDQRVGETAEATNNPSQRALPVSASDRFSFDLTAEYNPPAPGERAAPDDKKSAEHHDSENQPMLRAVPELPHAGVRPPYTGQHQSMPGGPQ